VPLDATEVMTRAAEWMWVPPFARDLATPEYRVVAFPPHFADPTVAMPIRFDSPRSAPDVVGDVLRTAEALGRDSVTIFGLNERTSPPDLEAHLVGRGAELSETLSVLAFDLTGDVGLDVPPDVEVSQVTDLTSLRDWDRVSVEVFGGTLRSDEELQDGFDGRDPMLVARRDGVTLGTGGYTLAGTVIRLWGAAVLPQARGTGVYRALLDRRLRAGRAAGCRMALVKGRVETSAPVLLRAGFTSYGEERAYHLSAA
jgi:GNAT superfamily N-acetyltransferase